ATTFNQEAVSLFSQFGDTGCMAVAMTNLGWIRLRIGDYHRAEDYFRQGLKLAQQVHDKYATITALTGLAGLAAISQHTDHAISVFGAIEAQQKVYGNRICGADPRDFDTCVTAARAQKDEALFNQLWEQGRNLTLESAIMYVLDDWKPSQ